MEHQGGARHLMGKCGQIVSHIRLDGAQLDGEVPYTLSHWYRSRLTRQLLLLFILRMFSARAQFIGKPERSKGGFDASRASSEGSLGSFALQGHDELANEVVHRIAHRKQVKATPIE